MSTSNQSTFPKKPNYQTLDCFADAHITSSPDEIARELSIKNVHQFIHYNNLRVLKRLRPIEFRGSPALPKTTMGLTDTLKRQLRTRNGIKQAQARQALQNKARVTVWGNDCELSLVTKQSECAA